MQLSPTDGHFGRLVERIVAGGPVVVLCAPPGFYKGRLAQAAARRLHGAGTDGIAVFGLWEHGRDPQAAAEGLLAGTAPVTVIEEAGAADGRLLAQVLDRIDLESAGRRVIFTIHQPGDLPLARMALRTPIDVLDADALRLRPQDIASTLKGSLRPAIRARIQTLAGDWPVALDVLTRWAASAREVSASWSDLDIVRESGLGTFIAQEVLASLTPAECAALTHASWLDAPDLATLRAIDSQRREDTVVADLAYRLKGLVDRQGQRIHLHPALRVLLRDGPQTAGAGRTARACCWPWPTTIPARASLPKLPRWPGWQAIPAVSANMPMRMARCASGSSTAFPFCANSSRNPAWRTWLPRSCCG
jgi:LuxR family maltose regulon positive regulatory protein